MTTFLNSCDVLAVFDKRRINGTIQFDEWLAGIDINETLTMISDSDKV